MKLDSRQKLYLLLIIATSLPFIFSIAIPTKVNKSTADLYNTLQQLPEGSTILLQSDWTNSTRGESLGQMEALLRILMRKKIKFAVYSAADPQAPQVARDVIASINAERKKTNQPEYKKWENWVDLGYFPNAEATANAMASDLRKAFAGKTDTPAGGSPTDVFKSPVLKDVKSIGDVALLVNVHASGTINILIERLGGRVLLASMCTGVMGPETLVYYSSGQLVGVSVGLRGVVEMETMMERGLNATGADGKVFVEQPDLPTVPGFKDMINYGRGMQYFLSLHVALLLLIGAVVLGNIPIIKAKIANRRRKRS